MSMQRAFLAAYSILFAGLCVVFIALVWDQGRQLDIGIGDWQFRAFISSGGPEKWAFTVLMALFGLMAFATLVLAIAPASGRRETFRILHPDGSVIEVRAEALEALVLDEVQRLPDVRRAEVYIDFEGKLVLCEVDATLDPAANVSYMTQAINFAVARVLEGQVGLGAVRRPAIRFSFVEEATPLPPPPPEGPERRRLEWPDV